MHVVTIFDHWFFHPMFGQGYQFWSGIAGSFLISVPNWLIAIVLFWRHINCHVSRCPRRGNYALEGTPYKLCKVHHPDVPEKVTLEHIQEVAKLSGGSSNGKT